MRIGVIGTGQLSRMLALSAIHMGCEFIFFGEKPTQSIMNLGSFVQGSYSDFAALKEFVEQTDFITYENENIPYKMIEFVESIKAVYPSSLSLKHTQDRMLEKALFEKLSIPTPSNQVIDSIAEALAFGEKQGYPFLIKKRKNGYDGKGLFKVNTQEQLLTLNQAIFNEAICEQYVKFDREVSIIAVNSANQRTYYDVCENVHQDGILIKTTNKPNDPIYLKAKEYIDLVIDQLNHIGCITFEFFQKGDQLLANEIAPRVHNSGHWTIEGAFTSQFENHIRAIAGLPLGSSLTRSNTTMFNIIGKMLDRKEVLGNGLCFLHDYKKEPRPGRKLGHVTLIEKSL